MFQYQIVEISSLYFLCQLCLIFCSAFPDSTWLEDNIEVLIAFFF